MSTHVLRAFDPESGHGVFWLVTPEMIADPNFWIYLDGWYLPHRWAQKYGDLPTEPVRGRIVFECEPNPQLVDPAVPRLYL